MKKTVILLMACLMSLTMNAQSITEGKLPALYGQTVKFEVDWSQLKINNLGVADWLAYRSAEQPEWDARKELDKELKPTVLEQALPQLNKYMQVKDVAFLPAPQKAKYVLVFIPVNVDKKGNNLDRVQIRDAATGEKLCQLTVDGKGGHFGTMSNLWGDGFRSAGKRLGSFLAKKITK